ncbi:MAG TPA: heavy metal-responsive transcriptional regulator [Blastocatellia bacterium]|nr:heavy metal-responsive transcriptional regulator [Blastocatellia bacterium]
MIPSKRKTLVHETSNSDNTVWLKIGEVAKRTGIGIETLRFYERSGLLSQPARTEGGYRLYDSEALDTLEFIKRAQTLGFTLEEIKRIIAESRSGQSPCDEVREIVRQRLAELDERLEQMQRYREALARTLNEWDKRGKSDGHFCGLIEEAEHKTAKPASALQKRRSK